MSARTYLRELTREAHDRVDAAFADYDLSDRDDYARFLVAHSAAFVPVERAIDAGGLDRLLPDWPERRRADMLLDDLAELGVPAAPAIEPARLDSDSALVGAAYVLEGSRLGSHILRTQIGEAFPRRYLAATSAATWGEFVAAIERILDSDVKRQSAGRAALHTFALFERAAR